MGCEATIKSVSLYMQQQISKDHLKTKHLHLFKGSFTKAKDMILATNVNL